MMPPILHAKTYYVRDSDIQTEISGWDSGLEVSDLYPNARSAIDCKWWPSPQNWFADWNFNKPFQGKFERLQLQLWL